MANPTSPALPTFPADITKLGRGKAQRFLLAQLHQASNGATVGQSLSDIARNYRGAFGSLMSAAAALAKRGLITVTQPEPGFGDVYTLASHTHA